MPVSEIKGEVVIIYLQGQGRKRAGNPTLTEPELVDLGGQPFIAGSLLTRRSDHWAHGRRWYVPVKVVESIVEFETQEAYRDMMKTCRQGKRRWRLSQR